MEKQFAIRDKKTANISEYMKEYRLKNLDKYKKYDRDNYLKRKYKKCLTPEEITKYSECLEQAYNLKKALKDLENKNKPKE